MKYEKEITVEVSCDLEELKSILKKYNFKIIEEYDLNDIYMIDKNNMYHKDKLELLKYCILLRNIVENDKEKNIITYKYKEYDENNNILNQGKIDCKITSINEAKELFEAINYQELIRINDHIIIYGNETDEIALQLVDNHIYLEIEENCDRINKKYKNIDEMKQVISKYNIPIKMNIYFIKKAQIALNEKINK